MCLPERYSRVRVDKNLSDMFPIKNVLNEEDALSLLIVNFSLENSNRRVGLKLNGTH
jgi:hypothetical protein